MCKYWILLTIFLFTGSAWARCCIERSEISQTEAHVDEELGWAHRFDIDLEIQKTGATGDSEQCKLEWFEKTDYRSSLFESLGVELGVWQDQRQINPLSPMWTPWDDAMNSVGSGEGALSVRITDIPALGLKGGVLGNDGNWIRNSAQRTLDIFVVISSSSNQCEIQNQTYSIHQYLSVKEGEPHEARIEISKNGSN